MSSFHAKGIIRDELASVKEILEIGRKMLAHAPRSGKTQTRKGYPMSNGRRVILCLTAAVLILFCVYPPCWVERSYNRKIYASDRVGYETLLARTPKTTVREPLPPGTVYNWIWEPYDSINFQRLGLQCAGALLLGGVAFAVCPGKRLKGKGEQP